MRLHLYAAFAIMLAWPALAQEQPIQSTITSQIEAFRAGDFEGAFTYASPTIQGIFGTPANFGRMVTEGYPMVVDPEAVEMGVLREIAGSLWQGVRITDRAGRDWLLEYQMVEGPEGWRINAVQLARAPDVGA
jgi:Domain of unknown function (DUF4864)